MRRSIHRRAAACVALVISLVTAVAAAAEPHAAAARFAAEGAVRAEGRSADGRFAGGGEARFVPQATSADGRFTLKATQAPDGNCAPVADPIFANGFES